MKRFIICIFMLSGLSTAALAGTSLTVTHGKIPDPTYLDLGPAGDSIGDQRIWEFAGVTTENQTVTMDFIITTTGRMAAGEGLESRMTSAVFTFGKSTNDQIIVQGIGFYPVAGSTVKLNSSLERAIVGGTGKYAGARGSVMTVHLPDGTWQHTFSIH